MDCVIPGPSVRIFSAAINCLSRVGKDLYLDFDPLDGLKLSALNDAKSAFGEFHLEPSFFERCTFVQPSSSLMTGVAREQQPHDTTSTTHSQRKRTRSRDRRRGASEEEDDDDEHDDEEVDHSRFTCRVPFRAMLSVIRARKHVSSLRLRKEVSSSNVYLAFEFHLLLLDDDEEAVEEGAIHYQHPMTNTHHAAAASPLSLRVVHRMGVVEDVNTMAALVSREECSELTVSPKVLLRMLEPLKQTFQVSLIVNDVDKTITATSFHHHQATSHHASSNNNNNNNAILQASTAKLIKTETCIGCDELDDFHFRDDRHVEEDDHDNEGGGDSLPSNVNEQVILVYNMKEAKAMLTFCATAAHTTNTSMEPSELKVCMSFHWGGKPIVLETHGQSFSAKMVLATLDHNVVGPRRVGAERGGGGGREAERSGEEGRRENRSTTNQ